MGDGDGETLPDPLEHPPDDAEVGADLRAAAISRQEAPTVDSFEGRLLQTFQSGEFYQAIEILSKAEYQSIDLRSVSDADGKTLLHLACRKGGVDWKSIVCSLIDKHHCDVAAMDEDGNTPLHEAYQYVNLSIVEYLLSLPTCNPDTINKQEYTVLRMALELNDKRTVRDLLATGQVDPRKGSSRGHTYPELLAMNQLQPHNYDGSALQMVTQFSECMESSKCSICPPFTSYCLHDTLHKILKNRDQVSITEIVNCIKENMLPLPANSDKIHDLLMHIQSLSDEFDIRTDELGELQVQRRDTALRYERNLLQPFPMPSGYVMADQTTSDILELPTTDDGKTLPDPLEHPPDDAEVGADLRAAATSRQKAPSVDSLLQTFQSGEFEQVIELLSQAESQSIDLRGVSDADGKTLLHLACRKNWVEWHHIVCSLVDKHHCDVAAVDEDGNTPLHEAYQCGNLLSVEYLLSIPTSNPDAINKHEYTVLRMSLEADDRKTVRDLLATGRVDPRKGSSRGHTYPELLAMNQLQPQDYDGSALQMVTQFSECMESSKCSICPPFTSYCLRDTLHKILKNRNQVSITGIVNYIKKNLLPLPVIPDEIHGLLLALSDEFDMCGEPTNNFGGIQVKKKGARSAAAHFQHDIQQQRAGQSPGNFELLAASSFTEVEVPAAAKNITEDEETPDYHSDASDAVPLLQQSHTEVQKSTRSCNIDESDVYCAYTMCLFCYFCWFVVFLILGICGAVLYNGYSFVGTTDVVQIHRQSVPLIAIHNLSANFIRLTEINETDLVPISFYMLNDCSSKDVFIDIKINEIVTVSFDSPTDKSKAVTEWYLLGNTTLTVDITTVVISNFSTNHCIAFFLVFDSVNKFSNFISSSSLDKEFYYKECIANEKSQTMNITFNKPSYYYIGLYTDIPTEATTFSLHFLGTYLQYEISNGNAVCTIDSLDNLNCDFSPNILNTNQQSCIVGSVPPIYTDTPFGVKRATVALYTAANSDAAIDAYFFIPLLLSVFSFCTVTICFCSKLFYDS